MGQLYADGVAAAWHPRGDAMLDREKQLLAGQAAILLMMARDAPATETLEAIVRLAEELEPGTLAGVTAVDRAKCSLEMAVFPSVPRRFADAIAGLPLGPPHAGICAQALYRGEVVTSEDLETDTRFAPEWRQLCADNGIRSCRSHPVGTAEGNPLGTFMLCFREAHAQDNVDAALIETCATLTGLVLQRRHVTRRRELVLGEFQHRARNLLSTVGALANFTYDNTHDRSEFLAVFQGRLRALAAAQDLILSETGIGLDDLLKKLLAPYGLGTRIELTGPAVQLGTQAVTPLSMTIHELATNAVKYGALSNNAGRVHVSWTVAGDGAPAFGMTWAESGGPPVAPPTRKGFGTRAIEQILASEIEGRGELVFAPDGLRFTIEAPLMGKLAP